MVNDAIGILDSGIGGLSIWREIVKRLPWENTIYIADRLYFPYGEKTDRQILRRTIKIVEFLLEKSCSVIVLACNSATVATLPLLRSRFSCQFVGVEPAVKPAANQSQSKEITVLATTKTATSQRQRRLIEAHAKGAIVHIIATPSLVRAIEEGKIHSQATLKHLKTLLTKETIGDSDRIVLGCTHLLFVKRIIQKVIGKKIQIVEPSQAVASRVWEIRKYKKGNRKKIGKHKFFTSKDAISFQTIAERLIGPLPGPTSVIEL